MDHGQFMTNGFLWPDPRAAFPPAKVLSLPWQLGGSLGHAPEYLDANISVMPMWKLLLLRPLPAHLVYRPSCLAITG
jgi:hypothetical protein